MTEKIEIPLSAHTLNRLRSIEAQISMLEARKQEIVTTLVSLQFDPSVVNDRYSIDLTSEAIILTPNG